jgi:lipoprotein NlpI
MQLRRTLLSIGSALAIFCAQPAWADDELDKLVQQAASQLRQDNFDQAIKLATEIIAKYPDQPTGLGLRASAYIAAGKSELAIADLDRLLKLTPQNARLLELRGTEKFKLHRFNDAIADFDKECALDRARDPWHWKRGLAYYYAGQYAKGRDQFEQYHNREDNDVENAVWRVLCMARMPDVGLKKAQAEILVVRRDSRVPMMEAYSLFAGKAKPDDVLRAIDRDDPTKQPVTSRKFYGHLYLGLYFDMVGKRQEAIDHLKTAVKHKIDHFMWDIANIHLATLTKPKDND